MMSNPAVFELAQSVIDNQKICIEDNIGESIHLHIGLVRIDMTLNCVTPQFFNVFKYDAYFLERIAKWIPNLLSIEKSSLRLAELKICYEIDDEVNFLNCSINESPVFKYYNGENVDLERFVSEGDIFQSNRDRADKIFHQIKTNSAKVFPICVDAHNRILDGYLTSAALIKLYGGNKEIEVERFLFNNVFDAIAVRRLKKRLW